MYFLELSTISMAAGEQPGQCCPEELFPLLQRLKSAGSLDKEELMARKQGLYLWNSTLATVQKTQRAGNAFHLPRWISGTRYSLAAHVPPLVSLSPGAWQLEDPETG